MAESGRQIASGSKKTAMKKAMPLVSVVIPTYERAQLLKRAIQSVLDQTYDKLDILVVDDASRDNTQEVVEGFDDPRIRYFRQQVNKGGSAARNTGIRAASGDYIAFLDDDDEWEPVKVEVQLAALEKFDAVLAMSTIGTERNMKKLAAKGTCDLQDLMKGMPPVGGTSALMARTYLLKELQFDENLPRCQDWDLLIRLAHRSVIGYVPKRLVKYNEGAHLRITNAAIINNMAPGEIEKRLRFFDKHKQFFGQRWYRRHVSGALLYGIKHQPQQLLRIAVAIRKCGISSVIRTLIIRLRQKLTGTA